MDKFLIGDFASLIVNWDATDSEKMFVYDYVEGFPLDERLEDSSVWIIGTIIYLYGITGNYVRMSQVTELLLKNNHKVLKDDSSMRRAVRDAMSKSRWGEVIHSIKGKGYYTTECNLILESDPDNEMTIISGSVRSGSSEKACEYNPEYRNAMTDLPRIANDPYVAPINSIEYRFRAEEINEIRTMLLSDQHSLVALSAEGGVGKSTIARALYYDNNLREKYSEIIWIDYIGNMDDSILNSVNLFIEESNRSIRLKKIRRALCEIRNNILLIVDNVNKDDSKGQDLLNENGVFTPLNITQLSGCVDIVLTTRLDKVYNYCVLRIPTISDSVNGRDLFFYHYGILNSADSIDESDAAIVNKLLLMSNGNPFVIMLLAKQAAVIGLKNLFIRISEYFNNMPDSSIPTIEDLILAVLESKRASDPERHVLLSFAILPNTFLSAQECLDWVGETDLTIVSKLADEGWLEIESTSETHYRMHDLVKSSVKRSSNGLVDPVNIYSGMLHYNESYKMTFEHPTREGLIPLNYNLYTELIENPYLPNNKAITSVDEHVKMYRFIEVLKACMKYCVLSNLQRARIAHSIASYSFRYAKNSSLVSVYYHHALRCLRTVCDNDVKDGKEELRINRMLSEYYFDYGYQLSSLDSMNYKQSEMALSKALVYCSNKTFFKNNSSMIMDREYALLTSYLDKAIEEKDSTLVDEGFLKHNVLSKCNTNILDGEMVVYLMQSYAKILDHWGYIITISDKDRFDHAKAYLEIAYKIERALLSTDSSKYRQLVSRTEDNLAYLLFHMNSSYYSYARDLFSTSLEIRKELLLEDRSLHLSEYAWSLSNYAELLVYIGDDNSLMLAEETFTRAIELRMELNDECHGRYFHYIAWSKYGLGRCLYSKGMNKEAASVFNEVKLIYQHLAEDDSSYEKDLNFVKNYDVDLSDGFKPWIGNHSHFSL